MWVAAYFLIVLIGLVRRGREVSGPWWFLLRSFFPNWRFYHDIGHQPRLFLRHRDPIGHWSDWTMFMPRAKFSARDLFHNSFNNLELAHQNLVDHLSADVHALDDDADASRLVTYRLVDRLVRELLRRDGAEVAQYQFEVRLVAPLAAAAEADPILISPVLPWT